MKFHRKPNRNDARRGVVFLFEQVMIGGGDPFVGLPLLDRPVPIELWRSAICMVAPITRLAMSSGCQAFQIRDGMTRSAWR